MKRAPLSLIIIITQRLTIGKDGMIRLNPTNILKMKISSTPRSSSTVSKHADYRNYANTMSAEESPCCLSVTAELVKQLSLKISSITQTQITSVMPI
jgi:hypothetical protein